MELESKAGDLEIGKNKSPHGSVKLEDALVISGFGLYNYLVILGGGMSLLTGLVILLVISFILPATDCDMNLLAEEKGALTSSAFYGTLLSSHLFGYLSDRYGRKRMILCSNSACAVLSIVAMFAPTPLSLGVVWFITGFIGGGLLTPAYVYVSEFCSFEKRAASLLVGAAIASLSTTYLPGLAWVIIPSGIRIPIGFGFELTAWRIFLGLSALPALCTIFIIIFLPESPKFLLTKGHEKETLQIMKKMFSINNRQPKDKYPVEHVSLDDSDANALSAASKEDSFFKNMWNQTVTLFTPPFLNGTLVAGAFNLGIIGSYNILMLWLPEMINRMTVYNEDTGNYDATICYVFNYQQQTELIPNTTDYTFGTDYNTGECQSSVNKDVFIVSMGMGIVQFIFFGLVSKLSERVGRKILIVGCLLLASTCYILLTLLTSMMWTIIALGAIVALVGASLPLAISIVVDFFPTYLRAMATCICMIFGRSGSSFGGQLFGILQENYCEYTYYGLTVIVGGICLLCFLLPVGNKTNEENSKP